VSLAGRLARRNLLHDRRRLVATAAGVAFSVTLVLVQLGLFAGLAANASEVIDRSPGDVWITGRDTGNFQWGRPIPRQTLWIARGTPGVGWAAELVVGWTAMQHPAGGLQQLEVVGFDLASRVGAPWNVVAGTLDALAIPGRIVLDERAAEKLGPLRVGDDREASGQRFRVAAMTRGITSFTTVPLVFASAATARALTGYVGPDETVYVVVGLETGASAEATLAALRHRLPHVDAFPRADFSARTRRYWMLETGMGIGFLLTSALAIVVGTVIVGQAVYAATSEQLPEYGTLKAMGMGEDAIGAVVAGQGILAGVAGALPGAVLGAVLVRAIRARGLEAALSPTLVAATVAVTLGACALAALGSVRRVRRLEPALVFRT
jgi:putative ABC transport system permease protein